MRVTLLGCGGSQGVPSAAGDWGACDPADPRNYRRRPAVLVETGTPEGEPRAILIDTPPDLREQLLRAQARRVDAVLYTHGHADHTHGLDDLRPLARAQGGPIPAYGEAAVLDELARRFDYAFPSNGPNPYRPIFESYAISGGFAAAGVPAVAFAQDHGFGPSTGFRIGDFAYSIDLVRLPEAAFEVLAGIRLWILDCQQIKPHPTHSHLAQSLDWIARVKPERTVLTHLGSRLDYAALAALLPPGVEPGQDGLVIEV